MKKEKESLLNMKKQTYPIRTSFHCLLFCRNFYVIIDDCLFAAMLMLIIVDMMYVCVAAYP